jgi:hypothetical protein
MPRTRLVLLLLLLLVPAEARAQASRITGARQLWAECVAREAAFNPSLAELYADDAMIRAQRVEGGQSREIRATGSSYKPLLIAALPLAQARGDRNRYSEVTFTAEGRNVRIEAERYGELKKKTTRTSLLVGPNARGDWRIIEESGEPLP